MLSPLTEYNPELETFAGDRVASPDAGGEIFSETSEMDLAAELLAVRDEQELEQFLGELVRTVARRIGSAVPPPVGQAIAGILKGMLKNMVPRAASAAGDACRRSPRRGGRQRARIPGRRDVGIGTRGLEPRGSGVCRGEAFRSLCRRSGERRRIDAER